MSPRKKTGVNVHSWNNIGPQLTALKNQLIALRDSAKLAIEDDGGTKYEHEEDDVGNRACCNVSSYKPHTEHCWVPKLRLAIENAKDVS